MTKKLTRIRKLMLLDSDLLCDFTDIVLKHFPNLSARKQDKILQGIQGTAEAQLAHCQEEHDQAVKEERQAIGKWLDELGKRTDAAHNLEPQEMFDALAKIQEEYSEGREALKRGESPEGIKEEK